MFRADFVGASAKLKPRVVRSVAKLKRLVSCLGHLAAFPISPRVDFPPRRVDFDFQIRALLVFLVSALRLDWLTKLPVPVVM